jgi:hypothetical protein
MTRRTTTALGIPCPWSGGENDPPPRTYWLWFRLYRVTRRARHRLGLHDWETLRPEGSSGFYRCTWCGAGRDLGVAE